MTPGRLSFAAESWFWPAVALFAAGAWLCFRSYAGSGLPGRWRFGACALKLVGLALLAVILLEPTWTATRPKEGANLFAILADNSQGMQLRDRGAAQTRGQNLREFLISDQNPWQAKLAQTFVLRRYRFDARLEGVRDFSELNFEGRSSTLGGALRNLATRFAGQPLAGVLLFTDGIATDLDAGPLDVAGLPPIYPVLVGAEDDYADLSLENVAASQSVFEDAPVTLSATLRRTGLSGRKALVQVKLEGKVLQEQTVEAAASQKEVPLRFQLKSETSGLAFYELSARLLEGGTAETNSPEATLHNNSRLLAVDRGQGPHRILFVGGRPNWDHKFLNRAVAEDPELQLVSLLRIARREPKFTFRGRTGESSNPLFRGFDQVDEETQRYDQPVLIRLNTRDEAELRAGFPKTAEDLYGYEAIVVDDLESEFFTTDQMLLVQRYVSERGGGFLMLGGADSLQDGRYSRTPIGDLLPLYLDRPPEAPGATVYRYELTREGWLEPWMRLRANEAAEQQRLLEKSTFQVLNPLRDIKPGAVVLATATDSRGQKFPAVAAHRFGRGRAAAIPVGDLWHGSLQTEEAQADLAKSWRQLLRWLIADVPRRTEMRVEPESGEEEAVKISVRARDENFTPLDNATVQITIAGPATEGKTNRIELAAEASGREPGLYQATYVPRETGPYRVYAQVKDSAGVKLDAAEAGWAAEPLAKEFAALSPNRSLLADLAARTGGALVARADLDRFSESLQRRGAPIVETYSYPLWHNSYLFLTALACLAAEWGVRRWKGLA